MQKLTQRRKDAKKRNKNVISDQFWDEPESGRNGVGNGRPEQNLGVSPCSLSSKTVRRWGGWAVGRSIGRTSSV